ncbi:MAG: glycosyltransferase family 2 protein [Luteibaculum sp.]
MVSIIIPTFNKADFIVATIHSVQIQTYTDFECIIVDDCSTDNSVSIIQGLIENDSRFRIVVNDSNRGGNYSRNRGTELAIGDYIIYLDADDILATDCLRHRVQYLRENPELDFAVFPLATFKKDIAEPVHYWVPAKKNALQRFLSHDLPWQTMQPIYRKSFLVNSGGFDLDFTRLQDVEFHTRILHYGCNFETVQGKPDCFFRIDDSRVVTSLLNHYEKWIAGIISYVNKFRNFKSEYIKYLNVTVLIGCSNLIAAYKLNDLNKKQVEEFVRPLLSLVKSGYPRFIIRCYCQINLLVPFHLPGIRMLTKSLLLL